MRRAVRAVVHGVSDSWRSILMVWRAHVRADCPDCGDQLRAGRDGSTQFTEVWIGVGTVTTCAVTMRIEERDELSASCDALPHPCGGMTTAITVRVEANEQCLKRPF